MSYDHQDQRKERARKQMRLLMARGEFAEARAARVLRSVAESASLVRKEAGAQVHLDRHAFRTRMLLDTELAITGEMADEVLLGDVLERFVTLSAISSDLIVELRSSTACLLVGGEFCRWIVTIAAEMLHIVESCASDEVGCRVALTVEHGPGDGVVMRVVSIGGAGRPMPTASGMAAIERTGRLMRILGGFDQAVEGDDMVYVASFGGCVAVEAD